jgi:2Fe-2S ferredoxin
MEDDEADQLDEAAGLTLQSRLGCQAQVIASGEIVVEIPAWNRNYAREGGH